MIKTLAIIIFSATVHGYAMAEALHYDTVTARGSSYQVADLDLKEADLKLYWKNAAGDPYESLNALRAALRLTGKTFLLATNSGIYAKDFTPLGLHIERGKILHPLNRSGASTGNFFMLPNGVFLVGEKGAEILETSEYFKAKENPSEAAQSGPLLLRRGKIHPRFKEGSENKKVRSGVGVTTDGHVIFAISEGGVGFWEFAMLFKETLHCTDALYLDGTISTLLVQDKPIDIQLIPFVGIWAATHR